MLEVFFKNVCFIDCLVNVHNFIILLHLEIRRQNTQHNDKQYNDNQHNDTQYNITQHNGKQYNNSQNNDTQHYDTQKTKLRITAKK